MPRKKDTTHRRAWKRSGVQSLKGEVYNAADFSFSGDQSDLVGLSVDGRDDGDLGFLRDGTGDMSLRIESKSSAASVRGRANICSAFRGERISVTVRSDGAVSEQAVEYSTLPKAPERSGFTPNADRDKALFSIADVCDGLAKRIFCKDRLPERGLVVVAGATNSAKSLIARGLIYRYLFGKEWLANPDFDRKRRLHLVTCEDPIEELLVEAEDYSPQKLGVDYTPRQIGIDVRDLPTALRDAKRQTPAVFYVGELRRKAEWESALEFAGSGHLIVTTAHAGSLVETFARIFEYVEATTPTSRGQFAQRVRAVIHPKIVQPAACRHCALVPALWTQTLRGVNALVADGLAAILPRYDLGPGRVQESCSGRYSLTRQFLSELEPHPDVEEDCRGKILAEARQMDLNGE